MRPLSARGCRAHVRLPGPAVDVRLLQSKRLAVQAEAVIANPVAYGHQHCAEALKVPLHMVFTMPWCVPAVQGIMAQLRSASSIAECMPWQAVHMTQCRCACPLRLTCCWHTQVFHWPVRSPHGAGSFCRGIDRQVHLADLCSWSCPMHSVPLLMARDPDLLRRPGSCTAFRWPPICWNAAAGAAVLTCCITSSRQFCPLLAHMHPQCVGG